MSDTARTEDYFLNETTGVFRDNTTELVTAQALRDFVVSVWGGYGGLSGTGKNDATFVITATYAKLTAAAGGWGTITAYPTADDVTSSTANADVTVSVTGTYQVLFTIGVSDVSANGVKFVLSVNGTEVSATEVRISGTGFTGVDTREVAIAAILSLTANDVVSVEVKHDGAPGDVNIKTWCPQLVVVRLK